MRNPILLTAAAQYGIHFMGVDADLQKEGVAASVAIAQDAQPALITTPNGGIPAFLSLYVDPNLIRVLVTKMKATEIVGREVKKGDWTTDTAMFTMIEQTGETSSYGDYNNNGVAGINTQFPERQHYRYQVITRWGDLELERAALAKISLANEKNLSSILTLNKFQNKSYFFGVAGLKLYGLLNDPNLFAPIAPLNDGGAVLWADKDGEQIYNDILALFGQLQTQSNGLLEMTDSLTLALSPSMAVNLAKTNQYNVNVGDLLKKNFPNLRIETAVEYDTEAGEYMQMIVNNIEGQQIAETAFSEKLRAHPIKTELSSWMQKKSQGTWGTIIYMPLGIAGMLGIG